MWCWVSLPVPHSLRTTNTPLNPTTTTPSITNPITTSSPSTRVQHMNRRSPCCAMLRRRPRTRPTTGSCITSSRSQASSTTSITSATTPATLFSSTCTRVSQRLSRSTRVSMRSIASTYLGYLRAQQGQPPRIRRPTRLPLRSQQQITKHNTSTRSKTNTLGR